VVFAKGTHTIKSFVRAVVYAPIASRADWIERELDSEEIVVEHARNVRDIVNLVLQEGLPRPQILVVDFDALTGAEVLELHAIRERGWFGTIFAIGKVPVALRKSLRIEQVLATLVDNALRGAIAEVGFDATTRRLPIFSY
jgi:hypothetical protein